jgi:hypothetical protein
MSETDDTTKTDPVKADAKPAAKAKAARMIRVVGPAAGRWRIGRKFGPEAVEIAAAELTEDEIAALKNDPMLLVSVG